MHRKLRITLSVICILLFLFFAYAALTVPMISATTPALFTIATGLLAWFAWPKHQRSE